MTLNMIASSHHLDLTMAKVPSTSKLGLCSINESSISIPINVGPVLDDKITKEAFASVYDYLAQCSVMWYPIGVYLKIPKEKLDEIEADYPTTSRRLAEMIDVWISSSLNCTWRALIEAVNKCDQTRSAKLVVTKNSEITIQHSNPPVISSDNLWEEKQKSLRAEKASFQLLLVLAGSLDHHMTSLRRLLQVADDISDEEFLGNTESCIGLKLLDMDNASNFKMSVENIIHCFQQNHYCMRKWADLLTVELDMVCGKALSLEIQKENPELNNSSQLLDITQEIVHTRSYQKFLSDELNSSLEKVNRSLEISNNIEVIVTSIKRCYKTSFFMTCLSAFTYLIPIQLLVILFLTSTWTTIAAIPALIFFCAAYSLLYYLNCLTRRTSNKLVDILNSVLPVPARCDIRTFVAFFSVHIFLFLGEVILDNPDQTKPWEVTFKSLERPEPFLMEQKRELTAGISDVVINITTDFKSFLVGAILGYLGLRVVFIWNRNKYFGLVALFFFFIVIDILQNCMRSRSWAITGALTMIVLVFLKLSVIIGIVDAAARIFLKFVTLSCKLGLYIVNQVMTRISCIHFCAAMISLIFMTLNYKFGLCIAKQVTQNKLITMATTSAIGGTLFDVCLLVLFKYTKFAFVFRDYIMAGSMHKLRKNVYKFQTLNIFIKGLPSREHKA